MLKLCFLIRSLSFGGAQRQLITLVNSLDQEKFDVTIITFYGDGELEKKLDTNRIKLISLEKKGRWHWLTFNLKLINLIREIKPDILHSYMDLANVLSVVIKFIFPKIKIVWGMRGSNIELDNYDWLRKLIFNLECALSSYPDLIIHNSYAGQKISLSNGFPEHKTIVIPNGIDTENFKPDLLLRNKTRKELGIAEDEILIGLIARLEPMKDHENFIKAAQLFSQNHPKARFICVGKGSPSYTKYLEQLTEKLQLTNIFIWAGTKQQMTNIYNALDICTLASAYGEGFPNVIGEAMACGKPCVVTDIGDSPLIVENTGGIVVPSKNPIALKNGWEKILTFDQQLIALECRTKIVDHFSVRCLVDQTTNQLVNLNIVI